MCIDIHFNFNSFGATSDLLIITIEGDNSSSDVLANHQSDVDKKIYEW